MNRNDLIRKWDAALRSGGYRQGRGSLRRNHPPDAPKFSCLGVLCDVAGVGWENDARYGRVDADGAEPYYSLPWSLSDVIGAVNPRLETGGRRIRATALNDHYGLSFTQIADCIRRTWPEAFGAGEKEKQRC